MKLDQETFRRLYYARVHLTGDSPRVLECCNRSRRTTCAITGDKYFHFPIRFFFGGAPLTVVEKENVHVLDNIDERVKLYRLQRELHLLRARVAIDA